MEDRRNRIPQIVLLPFEPNDQQAVRSLVLAGLVEHWGVLDPSKNPDLEDIATVYRDALFLVAWYENQVAGCGALVPRAEQTAEVVRMSVARGMRRLGIGRLILCRLVEEARNWGCRQIVLETTETWQEVVDFYLRCGFRITHYRDGDVYFIFDLD
jgi:GNAT superfamily N-acetyltransferase